MDRPVSRDVYSIFTDEFQCVRTQIWWKLVLRRCWGGQREKRKTQRKTEDVHRECASHLCTIRVGQSGRW